MPTPKSALRHRQISEGSTLTVPVVLRRSRTTTATSQRPPSVRQEVEPYEAETVELVGEGEEGHEDEEVVTGHLENEEVHRPASPTRNLRYRNTDEPITRGERRTTIRSVALRESPTTIAPKNGLVGVRLVIVSLVCGCLMVLILNLVAVTVRNFAYTQYTTTTTATVPTAQLDVTLKGHQLHFIAILLHQRLNIIAIDETDAKQTQFYPNSNPTLLSDGSVTLELTLRDVNGDKKPDLLVTTTSTSVNFFWQPTEITTVLLNSDGFHFKPQ